MRITSEFVGSDGAGGEWLGGSGPESDIVISTRARLARNLRGHRFLMQADMAERTQIEEEIRAALAGVTFEEEMIYVDLLEASQMDAEVLVERHLISRELARTDGPRAVCYAPSENVAIMVCEEDHLRAQVLLSGLQLSQAWEMADGLDDAVAEQVDFAFSSNFGYLTCCPTNVGTGLRVSVMLHLPALVYTKHIQKVFKAGNDMKMAVRGLYGEGAQPLGDFYQISNQVALGVSEHEILDRLSEVVPQFIKYERQVRGLLLKNDRAALENKVWRALGILRAARTMTSEETLELLSAIRLGVNLELLPGDITIEKVNELLITSQPAHLQKLSTGPLEPKERDIARATLLREKLGELR